MGNVIVQIALQDPMDKLRHLALPACHELLLKLLGIPAGLQILEAAQLFHDVVCLPEIDFLKVSQGGLPVAGSGSYSRRPR